RSDNGGGGPFEIISTGSNPHARVVAITESLQVRVRAQAHPAFRHGFWICAGEANGPSRVGGDGRPQPNVAAVAFPSRDHEPMHSLEFRFGFRQLRSQLRGALDMPVSGFDWPQARDGATQPAYHSR